MAEVLDMQVIEKAIKRMDELDEEKVNFPKTIYFPCKCGNPVSIEEEYCSHCKRVNRFWKRRIYNG
jgi:hypothetical protein